MPVKIEEAGMRFDESVEIPSFLPWYLKDTEILDLFVQQEIVYGTQNFAMTAWIRVSGSNY